MDDWAEYLQKYVKTRIPHVELEIIGMGDVCNEPQNEETAYDEKTLLSELLDQVASYVPKQGNVRWFVRCGEQDIAQLIFDEKCRYTKILFCDNKRVADLKLKKIQCRPEKFEPGEIEIPEAKTPYDMECDGILAYGVDVGRFVFHKENLTIYVIRDLQHIGPSDVSMVYQISKEDYDRLRKASAKEAPKDISVSQSMIDACKKGFLCGESAYCKRYQCTLADVDMSLA